MMEIRLSEDGVFTIRNIFNSPLRTMVHQYQKPPNPAREHAEVSEGAGDHLRARE
jgi:hypothetical protein